MSCHSKNIQEGKARYGGLAEDDYVTKMLCEFECCKFSVKSTV